MHTHRCETEERKRGVERSREKRRGLVVWKASTKGPLSFKNRTLTYVVAAGTLQLL